MKKTSFILVCLMMTHTTLPAADDLTVKIASKLHTEGVILAELMTTWFIMLAVKPFIYVNWGTPR